MCRSRSTALAAARQRTAVNQHAIRRWLHHASFSVWCIVRKMQPYAVPSSSAAAAAAGLDLLGAAPPALTCLVGGFSVSIGNHHHTVPQQSTSKSDAPSELTATGRAGTQTGKHHPRVRSMASASPLDAQSSCHVQQTHTHTHTASTDHGLAGADEAGLRQKCTSNT